MVKRTGIFKWASLKVMSNYGISATLGKAYPKPTSKPSLWLLEIKKLYPPNNFRL